MSSYYDPQNRILPGAGVYLQDQAKAKSAYDRAVLQLKTQRQRQQIQSGLNEKWDVDPRAQYGSYQQMLQNQGSELSAANEMSQQRGFFGPGLGNQGESMLRYGHAVQNLGFKNQLADWENQYQMGMGEAQRSLQDVNLGSLQGAYEDAYANEDYSSPYGNPFARPASPGNYASILRGGPKLPGPINYGSAAVPPQLQRAVRIAQRAQPIKRQRTSGYQR